jgi:hypothetical protein
MFIQRYKLELYVSTTKSKLHIDHLFFLLTEYWGVNLIVYDDVLSFKDIPNVQ